MGTEPSSPDPAAEWLTERGSDLSDEVFAGEEAIRVEYRQWITIGEGCRMRRAAPGAV